MIFKFEPIYKERIWGGQNLKHKLNKTDLPEGNIGESWEVSAHSEGESIVSHGIYKGQKLSELFLELGTSYFGKKCDEYKEFPLLVKYLDAKEDLSVQVHPNNEYALRYENSFGKEEIWYVIDAEPNSKLVYGLSENCTKEELTEAIETGNVMNKLNFVDVKRGDIFFIPAGTVHATGKGIRVAEVQQSSDVTYRVYDYDRKDKFGNKRELHIEKSLDVINYSFDADSEKNYLQENYNGYSLIKYANGNYFSLNKIIFNTDSVIEYKLENDSFEIFMCIEGEIIVDDIIMRKGDTVLLTVEKEYKITGNGECLVSFV